MIFHLIQPYGVSIAEPINQAYGIEFFWHWFKKTFNPSKTSKAGIFVAKKAFETYPSLKGFCADAGYRNTFEREVSEQLGLTVEISKKIQDISWDILPKRWIVERTFAWLGWSGRLAKDFPACPIKICLYLTLLYHFPTRFLTILSTPTIWDWAACLVRSSPFASYTSSFPTLRPLFYQ